MFGKQLNPTDILLNPEGSIYHLQLFPDEIAETIILVGDPMRVPLVSRHFDSIDIKRQKREFVTHTGYLDKTRISVISTGIGVGNVDIVMNEADALFNIDLKTLKIRNKFTPLRFIRLGTCGCLDPTIPPGSLIISDGAFAFDGLLNFYQQKRSKTEQQLMNAITQHFAQLPMVNNLYLAARTLEFTGLFSNYAHGLTLTCPGFYGAQGRSLRLPLIDVNLLELASSFNYRGLRVLNLEMETAAIYSLGKLLGHECLSVSVAVANRARQQPFKDPYSAIENMIDVAMREIKLWR